MDRRKKGSGEGAVRRGQSRMVEGGRKEVRDGKRAGKEGQSRVGEGSHCNNVYTYAMMSTKIAHTRLTIS